MTFRTLCESTLLLNLSRLLLVHQKETFGVLATLALEELPANVIDLDEVRPLLVCRIGHHSAFTQGTSPVNNKSGSELSRHI